MRPEHVIVGVDESPQSRLALRWAAAEAARRGVALQVVNAYGAGRPETAADPSQNERNAKAAADRIVAAAIDDVHRHRPDVLATGVAVAAGATVALLAAAQPGDLVVVGHHARSELVAILVGSTCQQVTTYATGSVAIVRGRLDPVGPVLAGFDGSAGAQAVLETAFAAAAGRGCGLIVLRAFRPGLPAWPADTPAPPAAFNARTARAALTDELKQIAAPLAEKYPDVTVDYSVPGVDAAQALVDASRHAQLIVVGSRGHGGFAGLLLGSVGLHLTHHADCPVLIARSR